MNRSGVFFAGREGHMGQAVRAILVGGSVLVMVPVGIVVTLLLGPLWSWLESSTGFELYGHSGPPAWCYVVVCLVLAAGVGLMTAALTGRWRRVVENN
jgi:hypothetical protein